MPTETNGAEKPSLPTELAERILAVQDKVDHPVITRCLYGSFGLPSFVEGAPYVNKGNMGSFLKALRDDISLMAVERSGAIFRNLPSKEEYPIPENCTPYLDANATGFYLKNVLPLVFVKTRRGRVLPEARVALKYLRENAAEFSSCLETIRENAANVLRPGLSDGPGYLFSDIVQPYNSFTDSHLSMRAGLWIHTPPGVSTVIGPPVNQHGRLSVVTGAIETDWHHFELFVVAQLPTFEGRVLMIEPGTTIAQLFFLDRKLQQDCEVGFSSTDPSSEPYYGQAWDNLGKELTSRGRTVRRGGISSIQIGCPHCFVSVTNAAEGEMPPDHVVERGFNPAYKVLKHKALESRRQEEEEPN